jgi:hypothetical protein
MRLTFVQACVLLLALSGWTTGCASVSSGLVANPTYQAWASFEPGASVTFQGTRKVGQDRQKVLFIQRLLEVDPRQVVLERSVEIQDGKGHPPELIRKVEPARIEPADNPRTNPQARVKDLDDDTFQVKGGTFRCKGKEVAVHAEFGGPLPTSEDVLLQTWVHPDIPGGTVKIFLIRKSATHDLEVAAQAIDFQASRRKTP